MRVVSSSQAALVFSGVCVYMSMCGCGCVSACWMWLCLCACLRGAEARGWPSAASRIPSSPLQPSLRLTLGFLMGSRSHSQLPPSTPLLCPAREASTEGWGSWEASGVAVWGGRLESSPEEAADGAGLRVCKDRGTREGESLPL